MKNIIFILMLSMSNALLMASKSQDDISKLQQYYEDPDIHDFRQIMMNLGLPKKIGITDEVIKAWGVRVSYKEFPTSKVQDFIRLVNSETYIEFRESELAKLMSHKDIRNVVEVIRVALAESDHGIFIGGENGTFCKGVLQRWAEVMSGNEITDDSVVIFLQRLQTGVDVDLEMCWELLLLALHSLD